MDLCDSQKKVIKYIKCLILASSCTGNLIDWEIRYIRFKHHSYILACLLFFVWGGVKPSPRLLTPLICLLYQFRMKKFDDECGVVGGITYSHAYIHTYISKVQNQLMATDETKIDGKMDLTYVVKMWTEFASRKN